MREVIKDKTTFLKKQLNEKKLGNNLRFQT
jgi:hypothetical protein